MGQHDYLIVCSSASYSHWTLLLALPQTWENKVRSGILGDPKYVRNAAVLLGRIPGPVQTAPPVGWWGSCSCNTGTTWPEGPSPGPQGPSRLPGSQW